MEITQFSKEAIKDPTNIIEGERYEFLLDAVFDEDDELYSEAGIEIRMLIAYKEGEASVLNYFIMDKKDKEYLDFALEDDEENELLAFCKQEIEN